jgi:hypothetical protein
MDSRFLHMLAKRNVIGYKERFMDVESLSVWTPVLMVHIVQRCADIYRGPKEPYGGILPPYPLSWEMKRMLHNTPPQGHLKRATREGEYLVISHGRGVWGRNVSTLHFSKQRATPLAHHTREAYYRFPHTHGQWTVNT